MSHRATPALALAAALALALGGCVRDADADISRAMQDGARACAPGERVGERPCEVARVAADTVAKNPDHAEIPERPAAAPAAEPSAPAAVSVADATGAQPR
jgi:hypothetical protein